MMLRWGLTVRPHLNIIHTLPAESPHTCGTTPASSPNTPGTDSAYSFQHGTPQGHAQTQQAPSPSSSESYRTALIAQWDSASRSQGAGKAWVSLLSQHE